MMKNYVCEKGRISVIHRRAFLLIHNCGIVEIPISHWLSVFF